MTSLTLRTSRIVLVLALVAACLLLPACGKKDGQGAKPPSVLPAQPKEGKIVMGFAQIGSESDWRTANSRSIKEEAEKRGIDLRFTNAQGDKEKQIAALRDFITQKVDIIAFSPKVETGYGPVLKEIQKAGIPVILTDRNVDVTDRSVYVTFIGSDFVEEGRRSAKWFLENTTGEVKVFELQGTPGASCAVDRKKGFEEAIKDHPRIKIIHSQDGNFESARGKQVTEAFLKTPKGKEFNALYAHNDQMALGAIEAMKEAGLKPGKDIKIVSIDAVKAAFEAMIKGELNCTVECNPLLGPELFDLVEALIKKRIVIQEGVFDQAGAKEAIKTRKY